LNAVVTRTFVPPWSLTFEQPAACPGGRRRVVCVRALCGARAAPRGHGSVRNLRWCSAGADSAWLQGFRPDQALFEPRERQEDHK